MELDSLPDGEKALTTGWDEKNSRVKYKKLVRWIEASLKLGNATPPLPLHDGVKLQQDEGGLL
jgi:hypothetical protein